MLTAKVKVGVNASCGRPRVTKPGIFRADGRLLITLLARFKA